MAKRFFFILIFSIIYASCDTVESLAPYKDQVFLKLYGGVKVDEGLDFIQADDGGYVIVGKTTSFSEDYFDILLVRTDGDGNELWAKRLGDTLDNSGSSIIYTNEKNGFVICGETLTSPGNRDIILKKTDLEGNEVLTQTFTQPNDEYGVKVISAPTGGYFVLGNIENTGQLFFFEVDEDFQVKPGRIRYNVGIESEFTHGKSVIPTSSSQYLLMGTTEDGEGATAGGTKNIVLFYLNDFSSVLIPAAYFGNQDEEHGSEMVKVTGGYIIAGYKINNNRWIPYIIRVRDDVTNTIWEKPYGDVLEGSNEPVSIIESNTGGYTVLMNSLVSRQYGSQMGIMKLDDSGNILWYNHLGSQTNDAAGRIIQLEDNYYVACGTFSLGESANQDLRKMGLVKLNPYGELKPLGK